MRCMICNEKFYIKRNLETLFRVQSYTVCDKCYEKYKININYNVIPLDKHKIYIYSLFDQKYIFKHDPFKLEFSRLLNYVLKNNNIKDNLFVYTNIRMSKFYFNTFNCLSKLLDSDLYIVCNYLEV